MDVLAGALTVTAIAPSQAWAISMIQIATAAGPILTIVLNLLKRFLPSSLDRYKPLVAPTIGVASWMLYGLASGKTWGEMLVAGCLTGFGAVAAQDTYKKTIKGQ